MLHSNEKNFQNKCYVNFLLIPLIFVILIFQRNINNKINFIKLLFSFIYLFISFPFIMTNFILEQK